MPPKTYESGRQGNLGGGHARGTAQGRPTRVQLEREAKTMAKIDMSRCLAAASDLEQEQEDGSQEARPKSADGAWMKKYNSSQARESGQGHHRPANAFTVVFPRRKSGQSCRMISQPVIISPDVLRHYSHLPLSGVAKVLGISLTAIKKACRSVGVTRWPHCSPDGTEISDSNMISRTNSSDEESNAEPALSQLKVAQDVASGMLNGRSNVPPGRPPLAVTSSSTFCFTSIQSDVTVGATPRARSSALQCPDLPEMPRSGPGKHARVTKRSNKRVANYLDALSPRNNAVGAQRMSKKGTGAANHAAIDNNSGRNTGGQRGQQPNCGFKAVDERHHAGEGCEDTISAEESRDAYIAHLEMKLQEATTMAACPQQPLKRMRKQESLTDLSSGNLRKMHDEVMDTGGQCGSIGGIPRYSMDFRHPGLSRQASSVDQDSFADERGILGGGYRDIFPSQESVAATGGVGVSAGASKLRQPASPFQNYRPGSINGGQAVPEPISSTSGMEARHGWAQYLRDPASESMFGGAVLNLPPFGSPQQSPRLFYH